MNLSELLNPTRNVVLEISETVVCIVYNNGTNKTILGMIDFTKSLEPKDDQTYALFKFEPKLKTGQIHFYDLVLGVVSNDLNNLLLLEEHSPVGIQLFKTLANGPIYDLLHDFNGLTTVTLMCNAKRTYKAKLKIGVGFEMFDSQSLTVVNINNLEQKQSSILNSYKFGKVLCDQLNIDYEKYLRQSYYRVKVYPSLEPRFGIVKILNVRNNTLHIVPISFMLDIETDQIELLAQCNENKYQVVGFYSNVARNLPEPNISVPKNFTIGRLVFNSVDNLHHHMDLHKPTLESVTIKLKDN